VIWHAVICENDVFIETLHTHHSSTVSRVPVGIVTARFYVELITALVSTLTTSQQRVGLNSESWIPGLSLLAINKMRVSPRLLHASKPQTLLQ
jgi:hypothetical protein